MAQGLHGADPEPDCAVAPEREPSPILLLRRNSVDFEVAKNVLPLPRQPSLLLLLLWTGEGEVDDDVMAQERDQTLPC